MKTEIQTAAMFLHDRLELNGELTKLMEGKMSLMDYADRCMRKAGSQVDEETADALDVICEEAYRE